MSQFYEEFRAEGAPPVIALAKAVNRADAEADQETTYRYLDELHDIVRQESLLDEETFIYVLKNKLKEKM